MHTSITSWFFTMAILATSTTAVESIAVGSRKQLFTDKKFVESSHDITFTTNVTVHDLGNNEGQGCWEKWAVMVSVRNSNVLRDCWRQFQSP